MDLGMFHNTHTYTNFNYGGDEVLAEPVWVITGNICIKSAVHIKPNIKNIGQLYLYKAKKIKNDYLAFSIQLR